MEPVGKVTPLTRAANASPPQAENSSGSSGEDMGNISTTYHITHKIWHYKLNYNQDLNPVPHCCSVISIMHKHPCILEICSEIGHVAYQYTSWGFSCLRGDVPRPSLPVCSSLECRSLRQGGVPQRVQGQSREGMEENIRASNFN